MRSNFSVHDGFKSRRELSSAPNQIGNTWSTLVWTNYTIQLLDSYKFIAVYGGRTLIESN